MRSAAFTLIELLVVVAIVALLASVVLASLNTAREKARIGSITYFAAQIDHIAGDYSVGTWNFDECTGTGIAATSAADSSGNGKDGTPLGGAQWSSDTPNGKGCSLFFDGVAGYVSIPTLNFPGSFTFAVWMKPTSFTGGNETIFRNVGSASNYAVRLMMGSDGGLQLVNNGILVYGIKLNSWSHIALTYDSNGGTSFYIDGKLKTKVAASPVATGSYSLSLNGGQLFLGFMDSFHVFAKDLTASEVGSLYAEGLAAHRFADNR